VLYGVATGKVVLAGKLLDRAETIRHCLETRRADGRTEPFRLFSAG